MARTKADQNRKAAVKMPRKVAAMGGSNSKASKAGKTKTGSRSSNRYTPRPVPTWQKKITSFLGNGSEIGESSCSSNKAEATVTSPDSLSSSDSENDYEGSKTKTTEELSPEDVDNEVASSVEREIQADAMVDED